MVYSLLQCAVCVLQHESTTMLCSHCVFVCTQIQDDRVVLVPPVSTRSKVILKQFPYEYLICTFSVAC